MRVPTEEAALPTYQYACTECGHRFEQVQSFSDEALTTCPECSGRLRKVFNAVGVVFKGSGFYRTDSRKAAADTATGAESKPAAKSEPKSGPKSGPKSDSAPSGSKTSASTSSSEGSAA